MNGLSRDLEQIGALRSLCDPAGCEVLICLPATLLHRASERAGDQIALGGEDCHFAGSGAHTGEISAAMLVDAGARYVILGHSERRTDQGESDALIAAKVRAAQSAGLTAILCVGETLAERDAGRTLEVVLGQLAGSIPDAALPAQLVLAYEPVWAIGTGRVPQTGDILAVHQALRSALAQRFGAEAAAQIPLLYGGSVKPDNAAQIFAIADVDGALVGGASLQAADFAQIIAALNAA